MCNNEILGNIMNEYGEAEWGDIQQCVNTKVIA